MLVRANQFEIAMPLALAAGFGALWAFAAWLPCEFSLRLTVAVCLFGAGAALSIGLAKRRAQRETTARRALETICRDGDHELSPNPSFDTAWAASKLGAWHGTALLVNDTLAEYRRRLADAEHARARSEVKLRRLTQEREQLAEVFAGLPDPILAIDQFDELLLANARAEQLFSLPPQNAEHRAVNSLLRCEELVNILTETRRRKSSAQRSGELTLTDPSGETHWYKVTCNTLAGQVAPEGESPRGAVAVLRDISAQKALQKRNAEFVSAVSHEMKAPLSGIKAYVELLVDGEAEDEATRDELLGVISSQADRLQRLIDNLLNLARIEAGVVHVQKELQPLNPLLEEALCVTRPSAEAKRIELARDLSPLYLGVRADRDMLLQAAINLLSNAIKYTPEGGRVTLRSRLAGDEIHFEVEDSGVGLSPEDAARVFEKFYRVKKDRNMAPGTGLGLPLARHIVEDVHGGRISVTSELGRGSVFRVALPAPESGENR